MKLSLLIVALSVLVSCRDDKSPSAIANDACSCLTNSIMDNARDNKSISEIDENGCGKELIDRLEAILDPMDEEGRAKFLNEVAIELVDTDCADLALSQFDDKKILFYLSLLEHLPIDSLHLKAH